MAIAYDATSVGTQVNDSTLSWSHTCTGSNRILFVSCMSNTSDDLTGVTYNSVSMTQVGKIQLPSSGRWQYLYYLIAPATGSNTITVTASGTTFLQGTATSYTGAKQSGQPDSSNTNSGTSTSITASTTVVASNCWLVMGSGDNVGGESAGAGTTLRNSTNGNAISDSNATVSTGSQSLALTISSGRWGAIIASIAPSVNNFTLTADYGSFTLTGQDALFKRGLRMVADYGSFALTGFSAGLNKGYGIVASMGSFILTGFDAVLSYSGWTKDTKNTSTSWSNDTKNSATWTNQNK
jgi:hypothetical protein